jgi:AhpD family alkylhydroperoxidase
MLPFTVPAYEQVSDESKVIFDQYKQTGGTIPNLYATIGYSGNALNSYTQYVRAQAKNTFHLREREAIYLIVSQMNGCEYCLASHTQSAIKAGWKEEDTLAIRAGTFPEKKWQVIHSVIRSALGNVGQVDDTLLNAFFSLGYKEPALIDLFVLINVMSFTNFIYRLTKIPIEFPAAKEI